MDVYFTKGPRGALLPADDEQAELLQKIPQSTLVKAKISRVRNEKFLRKYFALLKYGYDMWQETMPAREWRGQPIRTHFEEFREQVQIIAGFGEPVWNLRGEMQMRSKSISFAYMEEPEFEKLYSHVIDVLLQKVLHNDRLTPQKMRDYVDRVLAFS